MDMLSIRKVRMHGMKDDRWTTKDKIVQYKGLINLYKRDQRISNTDKTAMSKKTKVLVARLKKRMANTYDQLDRALFGDRQNIKNALAPDRRVQLAYQRLQPGVIIEHIEQDNFTFRKKLDLMQYQKLRKARELVQLKLDLSELEDMVKYFQTGSLPIEKQTNLYTGLVQDANLKKEAAIVVNETYKKIISVMRKDQIYFDQILACLHHDAVRQAGCMLNTITLGQLAVEYLDDRRSDFQALEQVVQEDMHNRILTLNSTKVLVDSLHKNIKFYIRRDSDFRVGLGELPSNDDVQAELSDTCKLLDVLKNSFFVNDYMELFNFVKMQSEQQERLQKLKDRTLEGKEHLVNKKNHAELMYNDMYNTMSEGTQNYVVDKGEVQVIISETEEQYKETVGERQRCLKVMHGIKISLQQIEQMCKAVADPKGGKKPTFQSLPFRHVDFISYQQADIMNIKEDCNLILQILEGKLSNLMRMAVQPLTNERVFATAEAYMQKLTTMRTLSVLKDKLKGEETVSNILGDAQYYDDGSVPTRADIKEQSDEIVQINATADDDLGAAK